MERTIWFTITLRGEPIATLAPVPAKRHSETVVAAMLAFTKSRPASSRAYKALAEEGRA